MEATTPYPYPSLTNDRQAGQMGTGVIADSIQRLRERFLDLQYRGEYKKVGQYTAQADALEKIEIILNEPQDKGFQYVMNEFWNSWQKLSERPEDPSVREVVIEKAKTMTQMFNFTYQELEMLQNDFNMQVETRANDIQSYVKQIADLNKQIADVVPHGYTPNDLYDQRDLLLDKLSKLVEIDVTQSTDGMVNVDMKIENAGGTLGTLSLVKDKEYAVVEMAGKNVTVKPPGAATATEINGEDRWFTGGEMKGLVISRDITIQNYMNRLDALAAHIVKAVNDIHKQGQKLDPSGTNGLNNAGDFFDPATTGAKNMKVLDSLKPDDLAAAVAGAEGTGNNENALKIYELKTKPYNDGTTSGITWNQVGTNDGFPVNASGTNKTENSSFDQFFRQVVATLGIQTEETQRLRDSSNILLGSVDAQRQSVSGVSLDEEMSNMIKFQHAYNAAARTITAVDEMLDKIINGMGLVGR
jgi:flagellar hook-associated protein 1 FlgK